MANIKLALAGNAPVSSVAPRAAHRHSRVGMAAQAFVAAVNKADRALSGYMADLAQARSQGTNVVKD